MWFIGFEVEQETSAPPLKKNPGSALCACVDSETQNEGVRIIRSLEYHPAHNFETKSNSTCIWLPFSCERCTKINTENSLWGGYMFNFFKSMSIDLV